MIEIEGFIRTAQLYGVGTPFFSLQDMNDNYISTSEDMCNDMSDQYFYNSGIACIMMLCLCDWNWEDIHEIHDGWRQSRQGDWKILCFKAFQLLQCMV